MKKALAKILEGFLHILAFMPLWVLYGIADAMFFLVFYIFRYRRKVVEKNLRESFPEKSDKEIREISKQFFRNLADYIVETVKLLHISDSEIQKRMVFDGVEMIDEILKSGQSIAAYFSHCFNWEWAPSVTLWSTLKTYAPGDPVQGGEAAFCQVYRPLKNEAIDALMLKIRSRFNPISIPKALTLRKLIELRHDGLPSITGFMSDQKPSHGDPGYPMMWLNHPTAFITGTETLARKMKMAVIYWDMEKPSRGHYKITCRLISRDLSSEPEHYATAKFAEMLEATIRRNPAIWLWSHKRWKIPVELAQ